MASFTPARTQFSKRRMKRFKDVDATREHPPVRYLLPIFLEL